ncbi:hypothetical protein KDK_62750 [Dictyobacter kobayashii]|uniref:Uncharacterized protein n=1 Tax=Dictyobacter kobayashii TaxID=2014872 RepID=A0A402ATT5_9CHLR|nr:hypothetical protein KDK_62750 [Dictyobacter kobayashii]
MACHHHLGPRGAQKGFPLLGTAWAEMMVYKGAERRGYRAPQTVGQAGAEPGTYGRNGSRGEVDGFMLGVGR